MAPPYSSGFLVRSLVRVSGSGRDSTASATQIDLSNVSSLAATVPVTHPLPRQLLLPPNTTEKNCKTPPQWNAEILSPSQDGVNKSSLARQQQHTATAQARKQQKTAIAHTRVTAKNLGKRMRDQNPEDEAQMHQPRHKIRKCENVSQGRNANTSPAVLSHDGLAIFLPAQGQQLNLVPYTFLVNPTQTQHQNPPIPTSNKCISVLDVLHECKALKEEIAELQAKLSLFKQLFMNKQKLISVVRTLGLNIA